VQSTSSSMREMYKTRYYMPLFESLNIDPVENGPVPDPYHLE
jgi:hypothetical protein